MKKLILLCIIIVSCSPEVEKKEKPGKTPAVTQKTEIKEKIPLYSESRISFKNISGKWMLMYPNKYGYRFSFTKNFKSIVILYLKNSALVFKGVYTIEENLLKINIYEMKNSSTGYINLYRHFTKVKSSQFIFSGVIRTYKNKKKFLILKPVKIMIDGNTSDGYFEPVIKLKNIL